MKRVTVTIPDKLEAKLEDYLANQATPPSLTTVMQTALNEYLKGEELRKRGYRPARGILRITPAKKGSGKRDTSISD